MLGTFQRRRSRRTTTISRKSFCIYINIGLYICTHIDPYISCACMTHSVLIYIMQISPDDMCLYCIYVHLFTCVYMYTHAPTYTFSHIRIIRFVSLLTHPHKLARSCLRAFPSRLVCSFAPVRAHSQSHLQSLDHHR